MIEPKCQLKEWIVKNLDNAIDRAENRNPTLRKFNNFHPHDDNPNIDLSDKDQERLDKLKIPDFMEKKKSRFPTPSPNPREPSINYNKPAIEIPSVDIDQLQFQDLYKKTQPGPSTTANKPNTCSHSKIFDKFDFYS
jgi:hypothetical protein